MFAYLFSSILSGVVNIECNLLTVVKELRSELFCHLPVQVN